MSGIATKSCTMLTAVLALALIGPAVAQTDKARISDRKIADPARTESAAELLQERLRQLELHPNLELEQGGLAGSGLLLDFGREFLEQFVNQMGSFPGGDFTGTLAGFDAASGGADFSGARIKLAETAVIRKDTSLIQKGRSGDSRLMTGDASTTYTITSSHTDEQSSDGSQRVTETLTVTDDEGNSFSQTITHETNAAGDVTETQTVSSTDSDGNTTSESSCTGKGCSDSQSGDDGSSDEDSAADNDQPPPSQEGRPDPESSDCTGPGCEEFELFTEHLLASLANNRIEPQQGADTMSQPGEGTKPASGRLTDAAIQKAGMERLNPLILHDNAGGSERAPLPGPEPDEPLRQDPGTLVDPPEDEGSLPDDTRPPRKR